MRLLLAPMEGLLDAALRAELTAATAYDHAVSEFVRITASVLPHRAYCRVVPELLTGSRTMAGTPVAVQLLGSDPQWMAANASRVAALRPTGVDLNFGCPAPAVNRHRGGVVLLDELDPPATAERGVEWRQLLPLLGSFHGRVKARVAARHVPGRLNQWRRMLARNYPQAAQLFATIRSSTTLAAVEAGLARQGVPLMDMETAAEMEKSA